MQPARLILLAAAFVACARPPATEPCRTTAAAASNEAMVVATIHKGHLLQDRYPLGMLCRIVAAYHPDLVLVEVRPEAFAAGHYEDGPFEMTAVTLCARARGIEVVPIDWWLDADLGAETPPQSAADEKAMRAELALLDEPVWPAFDLANSEAEMERGLRVLNVQARFMNGNGEWERRQAWFQHRALEAIDHRHPARVLAFVGFNHAPELRAFLGAFGRNIVSPLSLELGDPARANDAMPDAVVAAWRDGIVRLRASADATEGEQKKRYLAKVGYFEVAANRSGRCCVGEADLAPRR